MKRSLIDILCCSVCKGDLDLAVEKEENDEVISGRITCTKCALVYPIEDGIPNMLPPNVK